MPAWPSAPSRNERGRRAVSDEGAGLVYPDPVRSWIGAAPFRFAATMLLVALVYGFSLYFVDFEFGRLARQHVAGCDRGERTGPRRSGAATRVKPPKGDLLCAGARRLAEPDLDRPLCVGVQRARLDRARGRRRRRHRPGAEEQRRS